MTTTQPSGSTSSNDKDLGGPIKEPAVKFDGGPGADFELFKTKLLMIAGGHGVKAHLETDVGAERLASRTEERAKHLLVVSVADNLLRPILKEKTARKMFQTLCAPFERKGRSNRTAAMRAFWSFSKGNSTVTEYVDSCADKFSRCAAAGVTLDDDLLIDKIMMGLLADYDTLQTALDTIDESKSKLTLPNLTAMLLSREALLKTGSNGAIESANKATTEEKSPDLALESLSAKLDQIVACMTKGTASGPAKSKDPNEKCYLPHHSRHTNAQCFKQHPELRNKAENIETYPAYAFSA